MTMREIETIKGVPQFVLDSSGDEDSDTEYLTSPRDSSPLPEDPNNVPQIFPDDSTDGDEPIDLIAPYFNPIPHEDHIHVLIYRRENSRGRITVKLIAGLNILPRYRAKRARLYGPP